jgi:hypothetical protein
MDWPMLRIPVTMDIIPKYMLAFSLMPLTAKNAMGLWVALPQMVERDPVSNIAQVIGIG